MWFVVGIFELCLLGIALWGIAQYRKGKWGDKAIVSIKRIAACSAIACGIIGIPFAVSLARYLPMKLIFLNADPDNIYLVNSVVYYALKLFAILISSFCYVFVGLFYLKNKNSGAFSLSIIGMASIAILKIYNICGGFDTNGFFEYGPFICKIYYYSEIVAFLVIILFLYLLSKKKLGFEEMTIIGSIPAFLLFLSSVLKLGIEGSNLLYNILDGETKIGIYYEYIWDEFSNILLFISWGAFVYGMYLTEQPTEDKSSLKKPITMLIIGSVCCSISSSAMSMSGSWEGGILWLLFMLVMDIVGLVLFVRGLVLLIKTIKASVRAERANAGNVAKTDTVPVATQQNTTDELKAYHELLQTGIITQEEFDQKKKQLLGL